MWDKNTSARLCAKNVGGAYARRGAYLRDTTVLGLPSSLCYLLDTHNLLSKSTS